MSRAVGSVAAARAVVAATALLALAYADAGAGRDVGGVTDARAAAADAQEKVYRCGPEGHYYSDQPCADGREVDVEDKVTSADRRHSAEAARRDARAAAAMESKRLKQERAAAKAGPGSLGRGPMATRTPRPRQAASSPYKHGKKKQQPKDVH